MATLREEWIDKAEADYATAVSMNRQRKTPLPDIVCFHCQQCAEKYFKAFLVNKGVNPPKTHNLTELLKQSLSFDQTLAHLSAEVAGLNSYSVLIRYPGFVTTIANAKIALDAVRRIRRKLREAMGL